MLFSEFRFWVFFGGVFAIYAALPHKAQNRLLLVASYAFYAAWDWRFLGLILLSTTVDFLVAQRMSWTLDISTRRWLLRISLLVNLGMLCTFKYLGFFVESFTELTTKLGFTANPETLQIILPVGISFFVFQSLSYTFDVYRDRLKARSDFLDFALFISFFPQLVAGPIERASHLLPEIENPRRITWEGVADGLVLCLLGLIKKVVIADGLAGPVDAVFASPNPSGAEVAIATWLFAIQIYCDFSGYTDIARGVAKILGFSLMLNFAQPYFARNPQEFWRRWHISLSTWLRDYLYVSLGGNRGGRFATYRNLMATMTLGGLWHGAAWNFLLWGVYQGALLCAHRFTIAFLPKPVESTIPRGALASVFRLVTRVALAMIFFQLVCYGWLLFRATSFDQIADFTVALSQITLGQFAVADVPRPPVASILAMVFVLLWDLAVEGSGTARFYSRVPMAARALLWAAMIYLFAFGATTTPAAFIYFQF